MLALGGCIMAWQLRELLGENPWYAAPMAGVLILAAFLHHQLQRPGMAARRRALLFGVGSVALIATGVAVAFGYSFVRLLREGSPSFDIVWICSGVAAGVLASWLWFRFVRLLQASKNSH